MSSPNNPRPQYNPRRQHREAQKKPIKRSGASPARRDAMSVQIPWWLWIIIGTALGVFVSFLISLAQSPAEPVASETQKVAGKNPKPVVEKKAEEKSAVPANNADTKAADDKDASGKDASNKDASNKDTSNKDARPDETKTVTKFDFYTLLPEREVIVPNEREVMKPSDKSKPADQQANAQATDNEQLLLQVGSFRSAQEAERRRAQIKSLGLNAKVEEVIANSDTWYRVQAGPFTSRDQLSKARDQLKAAGIESLLLRQK